MSCIVGWGGGGGGGGWLCNHQTLIHISRNQYGIHWLQWRCVSIMRKHTSNYQVPSSLQWRHNGHDSDSNHHPRDCLPNRLFRCRSKKTSNLRVTGFCAGNSPVTGGFPAQIASNAENISIWWRHHIYNHAKHRRPVWIFSHWFHDWLYFIYYVILLILFIIYLIGYVHLYHVKLYLYHNKCLRFRLINLSTGLRYLRNCMLCSGYRT